MDLALVDHNVTPDGVTFEFDMWGHNVTDTRPLEVWQRQLSMLVATGEPMQLGELTNDNPIVVELAWGYFNELKGWFSTHDPGALGFYHDQECSAREGHAVLEGMINVLGGVA
ncbi:MAG: hypothetical protein CL489_06975 [Acidobacteria bacterium]|nr:hypothetical protein [Acidobacteriota bacterium]|tara:strand:- start:688 stop:1026 length:339 start_codon:yes stop_codon:yes gene_type:complete